jgi:hypothetical protein
VNFQVYPKYPEPNSDVSITLSSFALDIDRAYVEWLVDGNITLSGRGEKNLKIRTKGLGDVSIIKAKIIQSSGNIIEKTLAVQPSSVDVLWESPDSYTPPFYKGKALPAPGAKIKVVAAPQIMRFNGELYPPEALVYTWKRDIDIVPEASGFDRQYFTFRNGLFNKEENIGVEVESQDGYSSTAQFITIGLFNPEVLFYEEKTNEGILFNKELSTNNPEVLEKITLVASPYFFSKESQINNIDFSWEVDQRNIITPKKEDKLTIKRNGDGGVVNVNLNVLSTQNLFQEASRALKIRLN